MSLVFKPMTEEEVLNLLQPGTYDFEVFNAINDVSKKTGNPMIKLTLCVYDKTGKKYFVTDYIMTALMYKLKHFCDVAGLEEKFKEGKLSYEDCLGKVGKLKLKIGQDKENKYPPRNEVVDYVSQDNIVPINKKESDGLHFNDEIPYF